MAKPGTYVDISLSIRGDFDSWFEKVKISAGEGENYRFGINPGRSFCGFPYEKTYTVSADLYNAWIMEGTVTFMLKTSKYVDDPNKKFCADNYGKVTVKVRDPKPPEVCPPHSLIEYTSSTARLDNGYNWFDGQPLDTFGKDVSCFSDYLQCQG